jgi:hypothetical protein
MTLLQQYRLVRDTAPYPGRIHAVRRAWYYWRVMR